MAFSCNPFYFCKVGSDILSLIHAFSNLSHFSFSLFRLFSISQKWGLSGGVSGFGEMGVGENGKGAL